MLSKKDITIIANWKMNPNNYCQAQELFDFYIKTINFNKINLIVAPPVIYLESLSKLITNKKINIALSAQNISAEDCGAFTGEISASMINNLGCKYTIVGHSECRKYNKETDKLIIKKFYMALKSGLIPIFCIGETKLQFDKGDLAIKRVLNNQLKFIVNHINNLSTVKNFEFLIAYEPVWAIGTGLSADAEYINNICGYIREKINYLITANPNIKILYGGSVNHNNANSIFALLNVDGALVGGASLNGELFANICCY